MEVSSCHFSVIISCHTQFSILLPKKAPPVHNLTRVSVPKAGKSILYKPVLLSIRIVLSLSTSNLMKSVYLFRK